MLSAQTNSLGRGYAAAPITDWFNPSIAHHSYCSSEPVFQGDWQQRARYVPNRHQTCEATFFGRKGHPHPLTDGRRGRAVCSTKGLTSSTALQETPAQPPPVAPHCSKVCPTGFRSKREHSSCTVVS
jgi:hypothetical protein